MYFDSKFQLDVCYDFLGVLLECKFCGNIINVNIGSFCEYIEFFLRRYCMVIVGFVYCNVEIDILVVFQYNDVDFSYFFVRDEVFKCERKISYLDDIRVGYCELESD